MIASAATSNSHSRSLDAARFRSVARKARTALSKRADHAGKASTPHLAMPLGTCFTDQI
jgi:hypothetical protein